MSSRRKRRQPAPASPPLSIHPIDTVHGTQANGFGFDKYQYVHWLDVDTIHGTPIDAPTADDGLELPGVGSVLGKYELVAQLGRGTTSVVFEGRHRKLKIPVAVKLLHRDALANSPRLLSLLVSE